MVGSRAHGEPLLGISGEDARNVPPRDLAIRFAFGAAISTVAALISIFTGLRVGGLLLAFPAILPATLTLIEKEESERKAADDVLGSLLGAMGLASFAAAAWWLLPRAGAPLALLGAVVAWLVTAFATYFLLRAVGAGKWGSR